MLKSQLPEKQKHLIVVPQERAVVLAEDGEESLALVLPPQEDLRDIESLREIHLSNDLFDKERQLAIEKDFYSALEREKAKLEGFSRSPVLLNRLANLAAAAGDLEQESNFIDSARKLSDDSFLIHRKGDNLLARNHADEAEALFSKLDLATDLNANLKLATFHVRRRNLAAASQRVEAAVAIDPTNYGARLFQGGLCLFSGDFQRAIHVFRLAAIERPNSSVLFTNLSLAYLRAGELDKAFGALQRAVSLDPLNANAVYLLADICFEQKRDIDVISSLRLFLSLEQKSAPGWARLARACLRLGKPSDALAALKMEASLSESSGVWNNFGVAYMGMRDSKRALQAFKHAMEIAVEGQDRDYFLAARNIARFFATQAVDSRLLRFTRDVLALDRNGLCLQDPDLVALYVFYLNALFGTGDSHAMVHEANGILKSDSAHPHLIAWIISTLVAGQVFRENGNLLVKKILEKYQQQISRITEQDPYSVAMFYNNIAFSHAEFGDVVEAERWLRRISKLLHKEPYPTATLGLIDMRKGKVSRGQSRYREAISLARFRSDKVRLRQKLKVELARYWLSHAHAKAIRLLEKVATMSGGDKALTAQAQRMLEPLRLQEKPN